MNQMFDNRVIFGPKCDPEGTFAKDSRIVHQDLYDALHGMSLMVMAAYSGNVETLVDYVAAKAYVVEKFNDMIQVLEQGEEE